MVNDECRENGYRLGGWAAHNKEPRANRSRLFVETDGPLRRIRKIIVPGRRVKARLYPARESNPYGLAARPFAGARVYQFRQPGTALFHEQHYAHAATRARRS